MRKLSSRKVLAGAACATLVAAGVALAPYAFAKPAPIATPSTAETEPLLSDDMPNAMEQARRAAREEAIAGVLTGKYQAVKNGASTVVDLGPNATMTQVRGAGHGSRKGEAGPRGSIFRPRFVEIAREKTDQIFVILTEFGNEEPAFPLDPTAAQRHDGSAAQRDPRARPVGGQLDRVALGLLAALLPGPVLRRRRVAEELHGNPVLGPLQRQRHGHQLGEGPLHAGPVRHRPLRQHRLQHRARTGARRLQAVGPDQLAAGTTMAQSRPSSPSSTFGTATTRPGRQLQRARRLPGPLPDRALRWRPGRR